MKTIEVDFTRGLHAGLVRANIRRASETLARGDRVLAFDPDEDMEFTGTVEKIDGAGFAYLRMDWVEANPRRVFAVDFQGSDEKLTGLISTWVTNFPPGEKIISVGSFVPGESKDWVLEVSDDDDEVGNNPSVSLLVS